MGLNGDGNGAGRMRVLFITKHVPEGPPSGGLIRTNAILEALRRRFDVRVVGYDERGPRRPRGRKASLLNALATRRPYQISRWDTPWIRSRIREEMRDFRPHALHVEYTQLVPLVEGLGLPRLLDMHNIESFFAAGVGDRTRGVASRIAHRDARLLEALEERAAREFDVVLVSSRSEADRAKFPVEIVPNGVHPSREPLEVTPDPRLLSFVGLFSWLPNIDGAEWLVQRVLPLLPEDMRVQLVGRDPHPRVAALAGPRVTVTGEVPDVWPYVANSSVVLAPILNPGGTRLKILEGLLAARPVVATPEGASGLEDLEGEGLVLAPTPEAFAEACIDLSRNPERAAALGAAGRRALRERYDWARIGDRLLEIYDTRLGLR